MLIDAKLAELCVDGEESFLGESQICEDRNFLYFRVANFSLIATYDREILQQRNDGFSHSWSKVYDSLLSEIHQLRGEDVDRVWLGKNVLEQIVVVFQ